jgi:hypothetical protein
MASKIELKNDFYVYSTHKTSTQSLTAMFNTFYIHALKNVNYTKMTFLDHVKEFNRKNNKQIKLLTTLRIPSERVISSYFQEKHNKEIRLLGIKSNETTVMKNTLDYLVNNLKSYIKHKNYPGESLYEIMSVFDFNFGDIYVDKVKHYGFYENDLIKLYILDFESIIGNDKIVYLENIFGIKLQDKSLNKSENKPYYEKYKKVKKIIGHEFDDTINSDYVDLIFLKKQFYCAQ